MSQEDKPMSQGPSPRPYMNPYLAGVVLGLVLLSTIYVTGRGLGASGGLKTIIAGTLEATAGETYQESAFFQSYAANHPVTPWKSWLFFEVIGLALGALFSGLISNRLGWKLERGPRVGVKTRVAFALLGGILFGFGSQLGRGCTSGSALSGMAVMSLGGIVTMGAIFGGAYALAFFFRKLWVK